MTAVEIITAMREVLRDAAGAGAKALAPWGALGAMSHPDP